MVRRGEEGFVGREGKRVEGGKVREDGRAVRRKGTRGSKETEEREGWKAIKGRGEGGREKKGGGEKGGR